MTVSNIISIGERYNLALRGYRVELDELNFLEDIVEKNVTIRLCGFKPFDYFKLRWLQTSKTQKDLNARDVWSLDDIRINLVSGRCRVVLIDESFDNGTLW